MVALIFAAIGGGQWMVDNTGWAIVWFLLAIWCRD